MKKIALGLSLLFSFSTFALTEKELAISEYNYQTEVNKQLLIEKLHENNSSDEEMKAKMIDFDQRSEKGRSELERMSEEQISEIKNKYNSKSCNYEPGYMFFMTKMALEDKGSWKKASFLEKVGGVVIGVPVIVGFDIVTLPFTAIFGFIGPKYCHK